MEAQSNQLYTCLVKSLESSDPEFAKALQRWRGAVSSVLGRLYRCTVESEEDLLQDLLLSLIRANATYGVTFYQHHVKGFKHKKNYELDSFEVEDGRLFACLKSLRCARHPRCLVRVLFSEVSVLKKSSLSSLIYSKIHQFSSDTLTRLQNISKGYDVRKEERDHVVRTEGRAHVSKRVVRIATQVTERVSFDMGPSGVESRYTLHETVADRNSEISSDKLDIVRQAARLSKPAQQALRDVINGDSLTASLKSRQFSGSESLKIFKEIRNTFQGLVV